ncbi:uncharacterized protein LOC133791070 [Humulus lupulus]|uniref:uncharacterized protein LOC133791070 n=1 Tax=Humulus lupulus TaxID=3486 RepID=UPI002B40C08A|nr:uncharacterized protein LOC133791070 [Humulus lupulus]
MCSEFIKSISFMGVSNSEMFLSEKDLNVVEFMNNFMVRRHPTLEFQHERHQITCRVQDRDGGQGVVDHHEEQDHHHEENVNKEGEDKFEVLVSTLKLKIPNRNNVEEFADHPDDDQENTMKGCNNSDYYYDHDGFKTPTSVDTKIPVVLPCPPAPRKPKSTILKTKRKANRRRVLLDLTSEIESLFPPTVLADLGSKIKKVRQSGNANFLL